MAAWGGRRAWMRALGAVALMGACPPAAIAAPPPWFDSSLWSDRGAWADEEAPDDENTSPAAPLTVIFGSAEIGASTHINTGFKRALGASLDQEGFLIMGTIGAGRHRERAVNEDGFRRVDHLTTEASLLAGYQWKTESAVVSVFVGPEIDHRQPVIDGSVARLNKPAVGARLLAEVWAHPSDGTLATGTLLVGTAPLRLWARHSFGWRLWDGVYAGPEAVLSLEEDYREARIGLHLTGFEIGGYTFNLAGGLMLQEGEEPGGYIGLTMHFKL